MVIINKETNKSYSLNPNNKIAFDGCHKIYICENDEDYAELLTVNALPDEEEVIENEIKTELVAIPAEDSDVAHMLVKYGLIERGPELLDFFEGVYFYKPTQELLSYMKELDEKYNK